MKEQVPSVTEKLIRIGGAGMLLGASTLPDSIPISAKEISQALEASKLKKQEGFERQARPSLAQSLEQLGVKIPASKGQAFRSYEAGIKPSFVKTMEGTVEASQTITETFSRIKLDRPTYCEVEMV